MKVICITGQAQHGKDTAGKFLKEILVRRGVAPKQILITHYADLLKYIAVAFCGWNGVKDEVGRGILQTVGTEIIRKSKPDFWVDFIIDILKFFPNKWEYVIIPDCRFPNEVKRLQDEGFETFLVKIIRDGFDNGLSYKQAHHESETAMDSYKGYGYTIHNTSLCDLYNRLAEIPL